MDARVADIVRSGHLRIGLFPSFMYERSADGGYRGLAVEIAELLAARLGISAELIEYRSPPFVVEALRTNACDVALLGIEAGRATEVDFTAPLMRADFTFLVPPGSAVQAIPDADKEGIRIAVVRNHAMDSALKGKLAHAETVYVEIPDAAFDLLERGSVQLTAGIRPGLLSYAARMPGSRVLADRYGANTLALAMPKQHPDRRAWFDEAVEELKSSGALLQAMDRVGLSGVELA